MPTEKRQRQKEGRQARLQAVHKAQRQRQLLRRAVIAVVVAAIVGYSAYKIFGGSSPSTPAADITQVSQSLVAQYASITIALDKVAASQQHLTPTQISTAQRTADAAAVAAGCPASTKTAANHLTWPAPPKMTISPSAAYSATVTTDLGSFTIALDPKSAPITVNSFVFLARHGYYNCVIFHRVIPGFMDQTGDPLGLGTGGPGYTIPDEFPDPASVAAYQYPPGSVAMANTGSPHSGGSQFFIVAGTQGEGLPASYTLFGTVTKGLAVIAKINGQGSAVGVPPNVTHRMLRVTITGP